MPSLIDRRRAKPDGWLPNCAVGNRFTADIVAVRETAAGVECASAEPLRGVPNGMPLTEAEAASLLVNDGRGQANARTGTVARSGPGFAAGAGAERSFRCVTDGAVFRNVGGPVVKLLGVVLLLRTLTERRVYALSLLGDLGKILRGDRFGGAHIERRVLTPPACDVPAAAGGASVWLP